MEVPRPTSFLTASQIYRTPTTLNALAAALDLLSGNLAFIPTVWLTSTWVLDLDSLSS